MSDLDRLIGRRRMIRRYADRPVDPELLRELVALGLRAPSAGFTQGVSFQVLIGEDRARYWRTAASDPEGSAWLRNLSTAAALVLVWCSKDAYQRRYREADKGWPEAEQPWAAPYWYVDAGMGVQNILLGATDRGLGACFIGLPVERIEAVRAEFKVPAEQLSVGAITLGWPHPDERPGGSAKRRPRRPVAELLHQGDWPSEPGETRAERGPLWVSQLAAEQGSRGHR